MSRGHTKLPWATHDGGHIQNEDGDVVVWNSGLSAKNRLHNSRFIVKAVNNHYQLFETLENIIAETVNIQTDQKTLAHQIDEIRRQAREAIKDAS